MGWKKQIKIHTPGWQINIRCRGERSKSKLKHLNEPIISGVGGENKNQNKDT